MTAHLTLVVDNSERVARSADQPAAGPPDRRAAAEAPGAWVHRAWTPRPPLRPAPQHPAMGRAVARTRVRLGDDRGAVTAEYAVVILAAVAFAGLLVVIMRSAEVRQMLVDLVQSALGTAV